MCLREVKVISTKQLAICSSANRRRMNRMMVECGVVYIFICTRHIDTAASSFYFLLVSAAFAMLFFAAVDSLRSHRQPCSSTARPFRTHKDLLFFWFSNNTKKYCWATHKGATARRRRKISRNVMAPLILPNRLDF